MLPEDMTTLNQDFVATNAAAVLAGRPVIATENVPAGAIAANLELRAGLVALVQTRSLEVLATDRAPEMTATSAVASPAIQAIGGLTQIATNNGDAIALGVIANPTATPPVTEVAGMLTIQATAGAAYTVLNSNAHWNAQDSGVSAATLYAVGLVANATTQMTRAQLIAASITAPTGADANFNTVMLAQQNLRAISERRTLETNTLATAIAERNSAMTTNNTDRQAWSQAFQAVAVVVRNTTTAPAATAITEANVTSVVTTYIRPFLTDNYTWNNAIAGTVLATADAEEVIVRRSALIATANTWTAANTARTESIDARAAAILEFMADVDDDAEMISVSNLDTTGITVGTSTIATAAVRTQAAREVLELNYQMVVDTVETTVHVALFADGRAVITFQELNDDYTALVTKTQTILVVIVGEGDFAGFGEVFDIVQLVEAAA
jgi:hypothetical protein